MSWSDSTTYHDDFGCSPAQYHAGLDKLWKALRLTETQDEDVFTLAAKRIEELERRNTTLEWIIAAARMSFRKNKDPIESRSWLFRVEIDESKYKEQFEALENK